MSNYISNYIWNDDERDTSDLSYNRNRYYIEEDIYIPIHKILKEMYEEEENNKFNSNYIGYSFDEEYDYYFDEERDEEREREREGEGEGGGGREEGEENNEDFNESNQIIIKEYNEEVLDNIIYNKLCYY